MSKKHKSKHTHRKKPRDAKNHVPLPRYIGKALPSKLGGFTWQCDLYVGKEYLSSMSHPMTKPNFLSELGATQDMKEKVAETLKIMAKAYEGVDYDKVMRMAEEV